MRRAIVLGLFVLALVTPFGVSSPIDGTFSQKMRMKDDVWMTTRAFRGGERACVLALSSQREAKMRITIEDKEGNTIAEDRAADSLTGNTAAVIWYPPRDGEYRITLQSPGASDFYVAIK